jgi:hypothetical protein
MAYNKEAEIAQLQSELSSLSKEMYSLQSQLQDMKSSITSNIADMRSTLEDSSLKINTYKGMSDIKGRRIPKWYELNIPFEYGETQPKKASVEISNAPFVCTQIQPYYLISDTDPTHFPLVSSNEGVEYANGEFGFTNAVGRMYPCTAFFANIYRQIFNTLDGSPFGPAAQNEYIADIFSSYEVAGVPKPSLFRGYGWNYPEFDFEIQIQGSGRYWTSDKTPAPAFYGGFNPLYLGYEGFVDTSDRLIVTAHPTTETINTTGIVRFVFFGYEISTDLTLSDIFGY